MQKGKRAHSGLGPPSLAGRLWWVQQTMTGRVGFLTLPEDEPSHCRQNHLFCTNPRLSVCSSWCHVRKREDGKVLSRLSQATSACVTGIQPNISSSVGARSPQTLEPSPPTCRSTDMLPRRSSLRRKQYLLWLMNVLGLQTFEGQTMAPLWLESPILWHYFQYDPAPACLFSHDLQSASVMVSLTLDFPTADGASIFLM